MTDWPDDLPTAPPTAPGVASSRPPESPSAAPLPPPASPGSAPPAPAVPPGTAPRDRSRDRRRTVIGVVLAVLAGVFAISGIASYWATDEILSSSTWESTSRAIASDPTVQKDVADALSQQIVDAVGLESIVSGALPGMLSGLSGTITDKVTQLLSAATVYVVRTDAFATVWEKAVAATHDQFVHAVDGSGGATVITSRGLELDLGGAFGAVQQQLAKSGIHVLDAVDASDVNLSFLLIDAPGLENLRSWVRALRVMAIVLPALAVLSAVAAFVVARRRWFALVALGAGGLLGVGVVELVVSAGRQRAIDGLSGGVIGRSTAAVVVDHMGSGIDGMLLVSAAVSLGVLVVGIVGVILGVPRRTATVA